MRSRQIETAGDSSIIRRFMIIGARKAGSYFDGTVPYIREKSEANLGVMHVLNHDADGTMEQTWLLLIAWLPA